MSEKIPSNFKYFKVDFKLRMSQLGTCTEASIYHEHVLKKAQKEIKRANSLGSKVTKSLEKFQGSDISERKEVLELKGVIRAFSGLIGDQKDLPDTVEELLVIAKECEEEFNELVKQGEQRKATVFMKNKDGLPVISTHLIIGNIKEILKIMVNNGDKSILKYKNGVSETLALDVKPVFPEMTPDKDIIRDGKGERVLLERSIRFERMGKVTTAIAMSEQLPEGAEFGTVLRVRATSVYADIDILKKIFSFGKSLGFGSWRGSSAGHGSYNFKIEELSDFTEPTPAGGWL